METTAGDDPFPAFFADDITNAAVAAPVIEVVNPTEVSGVLDPAPVQLALQPPLPRTVDLRLIVFGFPMKPFSPCHMA
jgi:hypothetical protein